MRRLAICLTAVAVVGSTAAGTAHAAVTLPQGFVEEEVARVQQPTAIAFTPERKMLVTERTGRLWTVRTDGTGNKVVTLDLQSSICSNGERGLLGIAVDPNFASNRYIYLYYTRKQLDCGSSHVTGGVNRISRFTLGPNNVVVSGSEVPLVGKIPSRGSIHNAGDLEFGKDKLLYATVGDGGCHWSTGVCGSSQSAARELNNLNGKVLRITRDGGIPADNPYAGGSRCNSGPAGSGQRCAEIFAHGLRNPFRFGFDPNSASTRFFVNDVGAIKWEEINVGKKGADYGWNVREGHCVVDSYTNCPAPASSMTDPIYDYPHTTGCASIVGGVFVPAGRWPAPYDRSYLFSDYTCGKMWRLVPQADGKHTAEVFATGTAASAVHFEWGPMPVEGEALYYSTFDSFGVVRRLRYVGAVNRAPTATVSASPTSGVLPLTVRFDAGGSSDPDGDQLSYEWKFGDGSAAMTTSGPTVEHTYTTDGPYDATVTVRDDQGAASEPATVRIFAGNVAPTVRITAPGSTYRFAVGDSIALKAEATDHEDGAVPGSSIRWEALRWHGAGTATSHTHPYFGPVTGAQTAIRGPAPEDLASTRNSYLEVRVTATDSEGLSSTETRRIDARWTEIQFDTKPQGAEMIAGGVRFVTPRNFTTWVNWGIFASPPATWTSKTAGVTLKYTFQRWEDGATARERTIVTPSTASYWRANYSAGP